MARTKSIPNRAELIVETAIELFSRYGYERTSIEDIAKHLGIGKGSIYLDFKTKEDILMKIVECHALRLQSMMDTKMERLEGSPLNCLRDMFETCIMAVYDNVTRDIHTPEALLHTSLQFKPRFSQFYVRKRERVLKVLRSAAEAGEIAPGKATEENAVAFLMMLASLFPPYFNNYTESEERISSEELQRKTKIVLDMAIAGLKTS